MSIEKLLSSIFSGRPVRRILSPTQAQNFALNRKRNSLRRSRAGQHSILNRKRQENSKDILF
jgi:hypothetical protein